MSTDGLKKSSRDNTPVRTARTKSSAVNQFASTVGARSNRSTSRPTSVRSRLGVVPTLTKSATKDVVYGPVYSKNDPIAFSVT